MRPLSRYVFAALVASGVSNGAVQLLNIQKTTYPELSDTCISVLNQEVACHSLLKGTGDRDALAGIRRFFSREDLGRLCADECSRSLQVWMGRVSGACDGAAVVTGDFSTAVLAWAEIFREAFDSICLKDDNDRLCNTVLGDLMGIDPSNQQRTAEVASDAHCNTCFLSLLQTQLAMPLVSMEYLEKAFNTATSLCSETRFTLPTPPSSSVDWEVRVTRTNPEAPEPTPTCDGIEYSIDGKSCVEVATSAGTSTMKLIAANGLGAFCYGFPSSGSLCIPRDSTCTPYVIKYGDTCLSIAQNHETTFFRIVGWNPELGRDCKRIHRHVGYAICVSSPGGESVRPKPHITSISRSTKTWNLEGMTPVAQQPIATRMRTPDEFTIEVARGTRQDCRIYLVGGVTTQDEVIGGASTTACSDVAARYGIALENLLLWNPSLSRGPDCALLSDAQYCVQAFKIDSEGITDACVGTSTPKATDDCRQFHLRFGLVEEQFTAWNPAVGRKCENFVLGFNYCVRIEHYRPPGIVSTCNQFVTANKSSYRRDSCKFIEELYGLSHERFVAWNPALKYGCDIFAGYDYCVSIRKSFQRVPKDHGVLDQLGPPVED
ncbi:unnamed protein product [Parascedosporium putredinis]|uniref:LysM domain-containing protein n=1 Tax=Parascedosporium putredinis TaxID=1442378 RepID=A0A9P1M9Q2_9PEZI|nr:unnamed protein product [Parascedosporium putredinis]CAI7992468.1 unnamed protein product [Parascedosporium putredinis]